MQRLVVAGNDSRSEGAPEQAARVFNAGMVVSRIPDVARLATFLRPLARLKRNF